jgi:hypothetical protein
MDFFAPDLVKTLRRFPFAIVLTALATLVSIALINEHIRDTDDTYVRLAIGLLTGAIFSLAGQLWAEAGARNKIMQAALIYLVPIVVIGAMQVRTFQWIMPYPAVAIAFLWLSVSAFTKPGQGEERQTRQNHFWWMNHRAVSTAVIAATGMLIIWLGLAAIERSMAMLFGIKGDKLFYAYLLPFASLFLTPFYWFSTIPQLDEFDPKELETPDFLSRAIGFLGQFLLVPLLLIYSFILLAYAVQIVVHGALPEGTLGWMVLGYLVIGAATWLILHPPFLRDRPIVALFQRLWFWLTIIPIGLYALAVYTRINAYGLTQERVLLIGGGIWASLLTLTFLWRRFADIRLIPALAGVILLFLSIGPWNLHNTSITHQTSRLETALDNAGWSADNRKPDWATEQADTVRSTFNFLYRDTDGKPAVKSVLLARGLPEAEWDDDKLTTSFFNLPVIEGDDRRSWLHLRWEQPIQPTDLGAHSTYLGEIGVGENKTAAQLPWVLKLEDNQFVILEDNTELARADLMPWLAEQSDDGKAITHPLLLVPGKDRSFALVIKFASLASGNRREIISLSGTLFSDRAP